MTKSYYFDVHTYFLKSFHFIFKKMNRNACSLVTKSSRAVEAFQIMFLALVSCHYDFCWHLIYTPPSFHFSLEHLFFLLFTVVCRFEDKKVKNQTFKFLYFIFTSFLSFIEVKAGVSVNNWLL